MTTRNDIEQVLWSACDSFRGKIDSSRYKDSLPLTAGKSTIFLTYRSMYTHRQSRHRIGKP